MQYFQINPRKIRETGAWPDRQDFDQKFRTLVESGLIKKIPNPAESGTKKRSARQLAGQLGGSFESMLEAVLNGGKKREFTPDEALHEPGLFGDSGERKKASSSGKAGFGTGNKDADASGIDEDAEYRIPYRMIRSGRSTIAIEIDRDGSLVFRAPMRTKTQAVEELARKHFSWIVNHMAKKLSEQANAAPREAYSEEEIRKKVDVFLPILQERLQSYAAQMGVTYGRVTIRNQRTRWGSCSSKGNLNFNWRLAILPEELRDYVIVHELAHRKEMNHSAAFWAVVGDVLPDYKDRRKKLKEYHI